MNARPIGSVRHGSVLAYWNTHGFNPKTRIERRQTVRSMLKRNQSVIARGKGNRAWKRYKKLFDGFYHIAFGIYIG